MSLIRTPELYWRNAGPKTPWGPFDPDASLNFSFDFGPWAASAGAGLTLAACDVLADSRLQITRDLAGALVTARIRAAAGQTIEEGVYLAFTLRVTLSDGQRDDRTFYLLTRVR